MNTETTHLKIYFIFSAFGGVEKEEKLRGEEKKKIFLKSLNKSTLRGKDSQLPTATSLYQHLPLPTSSRAKKIKTPSYLAQVVLIRTKAPEGKLTKMSVPLSIFITCPGQGNHISNTGIRVKFPFLWFLMQ